MNSTSIRRLAAAGLFAGLSAIALAQTPQTRPDTLIGATAPDYGNRPVAFIYDTVPVTRAELAEFLIARGGYEKVELLVNKKIIDAEAAKRGINVTTQELEAALAEDLIGIGVNKQQFVEVVLSKYGKTYYEWMEDVVRPRIQLTRMCQQDVTVTEEDLKREFERLHGEKRKIQLIIWPKNDDLKSITRVWVDIRDNPKEFDRVATQQANPGLASTAGHVNPIGRNLTAEEKVIEEKAFSLKPGDVSEIFQTSQGYVVMKCVGIVPANAQVKFEDEKKKMAKAVHEIKISQEIPKYFEKLKTAAKPNILMSGPPSLWKFEKTNKELAKDVLDSQKVKPASGEKK